MKKKKSPPSEITRRDRLLIFDILRILFVAAIVYVHSQYLYAPPWFTNLIFSSGYMPFNIYPWAFSGLAVFGLIFISGAVLEYNYQGLERFWNYSNFLFRRFIRLYPAFWMSLVFGLLLDIILTFSIAGEIIRENLFLIIFEYTGFYVILGKGPGFINNMGWFITAIVCLYILYPCLSKIIRKYQLTAILAFLIISFVSRALLSTYLGIVPDVFARWFPLCNLFEFGLGIYIIQIKWYPKTVNSSSIVRQLSDLSFYVFLFHMVVLPPLWTIFSTNTSLYFITNQIAQNHLEVLITIHYVMGMCLLLFVSWIAMIIDHHIQEKFQRETSVEKVKQ